MSARAPASPRRAKRQRETGRRPDCPILSVMANASFKEGRPVEIDNTHINTHIDTVRYSFDPAKRTSNLRKHGFDLADAWKVIESGQTVTFEDRRFDYGEKRS